MNKAIDHKVRIVLDILRHQIDKDYGWPTTVPLYDLDVCFLDHEDCIVKNELFSQHHSPFSDETWLVNYKDIHKKRTIVRVTDIDQTYAELPHAYRLSHIVQDYSWKIKFHDSEYDVIREYKESDPEDHDYDFDEWCISQGLTMSDLHALFCEQNLPNRDENYYCTYDRTLGRIRLDFALFLTSLVIAPDEKDDALIRVLTERFYLQLSLLKNYDDDGLDDSRTEIHFPSIPKNALNR